MDRVRDLLPKVLKRRGLHEHAVASHVVETAKKWLQQELPAFSAEYTVQSLKNGELEIRCLSSIAAQECAVRGDDFLAYLRGVHPDVHIESIRPVRA